MRSKEEAHDYRYFPDPDLLPLELTQAWVDGLKAHLPELPDQKRQRFIGQFGLSPYDASVLVAERASAIFRAGGERPRRQAVANGHQRAVRPAEQGGFDSSTRPYQRHSLCIPRSHRGEDDPGKIARVFDIAWSEAQPGDIVEKRVQESRHGAIETAVDAVIAAKPDMSSRSRPTDHARWFVGSDEGDGRQGNRRGE